MSANTKYMPMGADPLNVLRNDVKPLPRHVLEQIRKGKTQRTQILDGSMLPQHEGISPYAITHAKMTFENEDDIIRCARIPQWSDERMRSREDPVIMWEWKKAFRQDMTVEFAVGWYSKDFFEAKKTLLKIKIMLATTRNLV